jgi:peptidoglycan/LPS O-acetylase OafA/YrhL
VCCVFLYTLFLSVDIFLLISLFFATMTSSRSLDNRPQVRTLPYIRSTRSSVARLLVGLTWMLELLLILLLSPPFSMKTVLEMKIFIYFLQRDNRTFAQRNGGHSSRPSNTSAGQRLGRGANIRGVNQLGAANCVAGGGWAK